MNHPSKDNEDKQEVLVGILPDKPTFRVSEVAKFYGVTERTVYLWIEHGHLKTIFTPAGQWRIPIESINQCKFTRKKNPENHFSI